MLLLCGWIIPVSTGEAVGYGCILIRARLYSIAMMIARATVVLDLVRLNLVPV